MTVRQNQWRWKKPMWIQRKVQTSMFGTGVVYHDIKYWYKNIIHIYFKPLVDGQDSYIYERVKWESNQHKINKLIDRDSIGLSKIFVSVHNFEEYIGRVTYIFFNKMYLHVWFVRQDYSSAHDMVSQNMPTCIIHFFFN